MATSFNFTKVVNITQLRQEINDSTITIAIDSISAENDNLTIEFKADLTAGEESVLSTLVADHVAIVDASEPAKFYLASKKRAHDGLPLVYATPRPIGHRACFQGASDLPTPGDAAGVGKGEKVIFFLTSKDEFVTKYFGFNETVWIKDGYIISKNAPFGATLDVEIWHPVYGVVGFFCRGAPIYGTGWFPLDASDPGQVQYGLQIRVTINNSSGEGDEQNPQDFHVAGRFELYRPIPGGDTDIVEG